MTGTDLRTAAVDLASSRITYYEDDDCYVCEDCGASWEGERNDPNEHANACSVGVLLSALKDQGDRPEWMRKAARWEGTSSFPDEEGDYAKTPTVCSNPECKDGLLWQDDGGHGVRDQPCPDCNPEAPSGAEGNERD